MQIKIKSFILSLLLILSLTACDSQLNDNYNSTVQNSEVIDNYATDAPSPTISPTATPLINEISYFNSICFVNKHIDIRRKDCVTRITMHTDGKITINHIRCNK